MKKRLNGFVALMVALLMTVVSTPASAQMPEPWWRVLDVKDVAERINDLVKTDRGMQALARKLTADGFTAQDPVPQPCPNNFATYSRLVPAISVVVTAACAGASAGRIAGAKLGKQEREEES